jgi:hypothetical protein
MNSTKWISEQEACELLGYTSKERFRRNVKSQRIPITYRSNFGRQFQYSLNDIKRFQEQTAWCSSTRKRKSVIETIN